MKLIENAEGQLTVLPFGKEIISLVKDCYKEGTLIQDATFKFLNALFGEYGLIVLILDIAALKKQAAKIFEDDLLNETPSVVVEQTAKMLDEKGYKVQANPREMNLFCLDGNIRERIIKQNSTFSIQHSALKFTKEEILKELNDHPMKTSVPNVILARNLPGNYFA